MTGGYFILDVKWFSPQTDEIVTPVYTCMEIMLGFFFDVFCSCVSACAGRLIPDLKQMRFITFQHIEFLNTVDVVYRHSYKLTGVYLPFSDYSSATVSEITRQ